MKGRPLRAVLVILWLFAVVAAYFWAHKPFDAAIVAGTGRRLLGLAAWLWLSVLGAALGRRLCGPLLTAEHPTVRLTLSAGVGLGLLSLLTQILGLLGLLHSGVAWAAVLLLTLVLRRSLGSVLADLRLIRIPRPATRFRRYLVAYGIAVLLLTFLLAWAPPTGWDTLVYHLVGPRLFVAAGRLVHPIDLPYLGFPQLMEMQFTLGLLLAGSAGEQTAILLHFGYGLLAILVTFGLARRYFGRESAYLAAAILLSAPTLLTLMTRAYVDIALLFYATGALYALLRHRETTSNGYLLLAGLYGGFCGAVKYTAVAVPVALGLGVMWASRRDGGRVLLRRLLLLTVVTVAPLVPHLLENYLTTGNPVYPFLLGGRYWDGWRTWWYDRPGTGLAATAPWRLLTAPLEASILGTEGSEMYDATIGPLLLTVPPVLLLTWRTLRREERAIVGYLSCFFGLNYLLWLVGLARTALLLQSRLLMPAFGAAAVLGGLALSRLRMLRLPSLDVAWLARAVVGLTLALLLSGSLTHFLTVNPLPVALGLESRDDYLTRRLGWHYVAIEEMNRTLPADAVVLFLWEPRSYYCRMDCRPDALLDRFLHTTHLYGHDAARIAETWQAAGVTHILLYRLGLKGILEAGFDPVTPEDLETLAVLESRHLRPVAEWGDAYVLYEWRR